MIRIVSQSGWQPIDNAPKDGTWIIGFRGGLTEPVYVAMRWWDGILPEEDDDLSTDEVGEWVCPEGRIGDDVTHWIAFPRHPDAPPITASFEDDDALYGIRNRSRAERGITQVEIDETRAAYAEMEAARDRDYAEYHAPLAVDEHQNDNNPSHGGGAA